MSKKASYSISEWREAEAREAELSELRALLDAQAAGEFVTVEVGRNAMEAMIGAERRALGL